jgi:hypothetical protein
MVTPSAERVVPGSVNLPPARWPATASTPAASIDAPAIAAQVISSLNAALAKRDFAAVVGLFLPDPNDDAIAPAPFWRDHLVLSWRLRTLKGREKILSFLENAHAREEEAEVKKGVLKFKVDDSSASRKPEVVSFRPREEVNGVAFFVTVENAAGKGRGVVRLVESEPGMWKIWTMFTTLEEVSGFEERVGRRREVGVQHGATQDRRNWAERRAEEREFVDREPEVLIIGMFLMRKMFGCEASASLDTDLLRNDLRSRTGRLDCRCTAQDAWRPDSRGRQEQGGRRQLAQPVPPACAA